MIRNHLGSKDIDPHLKYNPYTSTINTEQAIYHKQLPRSQKHNLADMAKRCSGAICFSKET